MCSYARMTADANLRTDNMINLGDKVKDTITGFTGIVVGITEWLNGCRTIGVRPTVLHEGKPQEPDWIDENQLKLVKKAVFKLGPATTGGPHPRPMRLVKPG